MRIAVIGRSEFLYDTVSHFLKTGHDVACILTAKEAPEYMRTSDDFNELALALKIPFAQGSNIRDFRRFLIDASANIAVSVNYATIIPQEIIDLFPLGILNAHGGDLPRYRGNACQAWAILNGENHIGLCIHRMIGGEVDSGDILAREQLPINLQTTITDVWAWMLQRIPVLFGEVVAHLAINPSFILETQSREPGTALRCHPRRPEDGRIDWHQPALNIVRLVNASTRPFAGAFCTFQGEKLVVWRAELVEQREQFCAVPGQVTGLTESSVEVACGLDKIRILESEYQGRIVAPSALIRSTRDRVS